MPVAVVEKPRVEPVVEAVRRFATADLNTHGKWLLARLTVALGIDERRAAGWLQSLMFSREYSLMFQPHSVALAQMSYGDTLSTTPVIHIKFVFAESEEHILEASRFYEEFRRWSETLGAQIMVLDELTDVPDDMIKKVLGRVFTKQQMFARV